MHIKTVRTRTLALAAVGALTLTGTALAAQPNASTKYGGPTSAKKYNGYRSQVTFKVSSNGRQLQNFTYQSTGCYGAPGGLKKGVNYLKQARNVHKLGTVTVSRSGAFSKHHAVTRYTSGAQTTTTISTVSGSFKSPTKAVGTIYYSQSISGKGVPTVKPCGRVKITFTATAAQQTGGYGGY